MTSAAPSEPAEPILRLRGVGRRFGGLHAVRDVDVEVAPGERRAILGPNGAGKTTLFNLVCGDFPVTAGTVELLGRDVTPLPARTRAKMGLARTYQQSRLFGGLSVDEVAEVMSLSKTTVESEWRSARAWLLARMNR